MIELSKLLMLVLIVAARADEQGKKSGLSQFWSDDFKVFEQIYGKTSDKDLYGVTLPPNIRYDIVNPKHAASDKQERYLNIHGMTNVDLEQDKYAKLFAKSLYDDKTKGSSALQFISFSDFKPINAVNNPETYNYLKNLENQHKIDFPQKEFGGFKPYKQPEDKEAKDAYKSIQDILDAHEANKGKYKEIIPENHSKRKQKHKNNYAGSQNRNKVTFLHGNSLNSRCTSGKCRKRFVNSAHFNRPYLRKIHHYRYIRR